MLEWVTKPTLPELTAEFCGRLHAAAGVLQGEFPMALTGGSAAGVFYDALAEHGVPGRLRFYWSDERLVPPTDPDSNFKLAADRLLRPAAVEEKHIHPAATQLPPTECAASYAEEIRRKVDRGPGGVPRFPLILLGLGADGHTASLFPGRDPYQDDELLVRAVEGTAMHPHARITFTPKLINSAREVWFLIVGANKAWAVEQLAERQAPVSQIPALVVDPDETRISIFADDSATGGRRY